ncbi:MAG: M20 family metallopeptidase [Gemmatimonadaceae bacterium]|jgi:amidohydrolase|nr:M20 family metallopeptidase [Gemmatimonadaceae bacterium]
MSSPTLTPDALIPSLLASAESLAPQVIAWRRHLHRHPELSFEEHATAQYVYDVLVALPGLELSRPTATSVVARLRGALPGRTIAVRADMDALPIHEENDTPYRSTKPGVMHACGHDGHTSILLGLATVLAAARDRLHGEVRFIFQHAEELSPGGADALVDAGVMDGVDDVIGLHLWSSMPVGHIGLVAGPAMAAPDTFQCTITGRGGHAALPHDTIDPIAIGAQVVSALQQIVSRQVDPLEPAVLSVTQFIAGTAFNVIPNSAYLSGTVRTFDATLRRQIPERMDRLIRGICDGFGATCEFTYELGYRPVVNDAALTARLADLVSRTFGEHVLTPLRPVMGGEDFSAYQQRAPGVFAFVGAGNVARGITAAHHHPRFDIDEASLDVGLRYLVAATVELLGG